MSLNKALKAKIKKRCRKVFSRFDSIPSGSEVDLLAEARFVVHHRIVSADFKRLVYRLPCGLVHQNRDGVPVNHPVVVVRRDCLGRVYVKESRYHGRR